MKQIFIEKVERLKEYSDTVCEADNLLSSNLSEGLVGHMIDDIGDLLLKLANPSLEGIHLDYFSEALWSEIYSKEENDWGTFYDEIQKGEAPEEYVRQYQHCYD